MEDRLSSCLWSEGSRKSTKTFESTSVPDRERKRVCAEYVYGFFSPQWRKVGPRPHKLPTIHKATQQITIHASAGFIPAIPANKRQQAYGLDRTATEIGKYGT